jgi:hypothetical protein
MDALAAIHDAAVQMIDTSAARMHQNGICIVGNAEQHMGRSRGGLAIKSVAPLPPGPLRAQPAAGAASTATGFQSAQSGAAGPNSQAK